MSSCNEKLDVPPSRMQALLHRHEEALDCRNAELSGHPFVVSPLLRPNKGTSLPVKQLNLHTDMPLQTKKPLQSGASGFSFGPKSCDGLG